MAFPLPLPLPLFKVWGGERFLAALSEDLSLLPTIQSGRSELPETLAPEDLKPSSGFSGHCTHVYIPTSGLITHIPN